MFLTVTNGDGDMGEVQAGRTGRDRVSVIAGIKFLKSDRHLPNSMSMMGKLIRVFFAILIATALVGAPAVQAAAAMSCDTTVASMAGHPPSGHFRTPAPCKEKMPGCTDMLGCGVSASLDARVAVATNEQVWTPATYWPIAGSLDGLVVTPDLGPPITI
jgi:hypothetical protein